MIYPLSHSQKKAAYIQFTELEMEVDEIVDSFNCEGFPVSRMQIESALFAMKEAA